ncbi:MAG: hypothetical protein JXN64_09550 [Spirochaetes bacterium]|nr:hypothetical protein [Spirochaetota bacterium]
MNSYNDAYETYINLKKLYIRWNRGLLKSKRSYKRFIYKYLVSSIGREILTDYDYVLISPEGRYEKYLTCNMLLDKWLRIKGNIKNETLTKIVEKEPDLLLKWWRSKKLLSVYGRIKDFKLESDKSGEIVILYLTDIQVKENDDDSTGKNIK